MESCRVKSRRPDRIGSGPLASDGLDWWTGGRPRVVVRFGHGRRRFDVLIHPEQVGRVVLPLDQGESIVVRAVRSADAILFVLCKEIYVHGSSGKWGRRVE